MTDIASPALSREQAEELTGRIATWASDGLPLIREAYEGRADEALGYGSWEAYCRDRLGGIRVPVESRPAAVAALTDSGMSARAIGQALGIGKSTVNREQRSSSTVPSGTVERPAKVKSLDGRERPSVPARPTYDPEAAEQAEAERRRRVATGLLCGAVVTIAHLRGGDTAYNYDPAFAGAGRPVTQAVIRDAIVCLNDMLETFQERDLP